jgi:hypothetical protein
MTVAINVFSEEDDVFLPELRISTFDDLQLLHYMTRQRGGASNRIIWQKTRGAA